MSGVESKESDNLKQGVIFAICRGGEIVLQKRLNPDKSYYGYTIIPGGKAEVGETLEDALVREVREETGVLVKKFKFIGSVDVITEKDNHYIHNLFLVTEFDGKVENNRELDAQIFSAPFAEAKLICKHSFSQQILDLIELELSGQNR